MAKTGRAQASASGKKKKKSKGAKHLLSGPASAAMKAARPTAKPSPFETIWSRRKFDVLGKRRKGEERRIGLARSLALEKRKKTLLKEYEESAKSSVFLDKRIGEKDDTLKEFDKAVLRLQRQRQLKVKRTQKYNLSDEDEDEATFYPAHSPERDDFDDEVPPDDEEEAYIGIKNNAKQARHLSLLALSDSGDANLFDGEENIQKSKSQVMKEIIGKSKMYKAQKAKEKEEDVHLMEKLDEDFTSLAQTEALLSLTRPSKMDTLKSLLDNHSTKQSFVEGSSGSLEKDSSKKEQPDVYDKLVKELVLDRRAYASDRTKTPEEIALEEKERLEELEKKRQERMLATDDSSDEGNEDSEDIQKPLSRPLSGDDLGDSLSVDRDAINRKGWINNIYNQSDVDTCDKGSLSSKDSEGDEVDEGIDEDNEEDDEVDGQSDGDNSSRDAYNMSSVKDWEQSDDDDLLVDDVEAEQLNEKEMNVKENSPPISHIVKSSGNMAQLKDDSLPYVIEAPKNLTELCDLLDKRSDTEIVEAINRIRACNSVKLAAENRKKMQVFYGVLLQYFAVLFTRSPLNVKIINSLVKPLIEMSAETPYFAAICARQRLIHIRAHFVEDLKISGKSCWPTLKTLLLLRLWSMIFPCSDFRHVVMTPVLLLMCEYLMRCPISSGRDIAIGSFLCSMVLLVTQQSHKFCPEAIVFLQTVLVTSIELKLGQQKHLELNNLMEIRTLKPWLYLCDQVHDVHPIDLFEVMEKQDDSPFFTSDDFKASILVSVAETLKGFVIIYDQFSSFAEIFSPLAALLHEVLKSAKLPSLLRIKIQDVSDLIKQKTYQHNVLRQPLQMRKQKPIPIKQLNPKFEDNFVKGRDYDPDRERAEMKKLKKRLKSEKKGAMRELRKDSQFISGLKEMNRLMQEEDRAEKYGKALAFLQEQEHAIKSGQLGKGRKRRK